MSDGARALPQTVLREATDRALLDETIRQGRTTRVDLAAATGYSRPTVSESVRRLVAGGLLDATGLKETGRRGRVGTFYSLSPQAGWAMALEMSQAGIRVRATDLGAREIAARDCPPTAPGDIAALTTSVRAAVTETLAEVGDAGPLRAAGVSIANPVDPATRAVVPLDGTPFPEGLVSPAAMIADLVAAPVLVDNDVNLAALAEHRGGRAAGTDSFAYVYVGAGLGVGLYLNGRLVPGAHGLAGEIGYLPGVASPTLAGDLAAGGFGRSDAPSNDVTALLALLDRDGRAEPDREPPRDLPGETADRLTRLVARAIVSVAAVVDPALVVLGGPVGLHPGLLPRVRRMISFPGPVRVERGELGDDAPLRGAVHLAIEHARAAAVRA